VSFFGSNLFSSPKRWAAVNETGKQLNIQVDENYSQDLFKNISELVIQKLNN